MGNEKYKQCGLCKKDGDKTIYQTSWIPERYAKEGLILKFREGLDWDNGWEVLFCGPETLTSKEVDTYKARKQHRENTGDSLPKVK